MKQLEQPQKALPPMSCHRSTSWPLTAKKCGELAEFWTQAPWDEMQQHDAARDINTARQAARAQRRHKTTTRHGKRQARQEQQLKKHTLHC